MAEEWVKDARNDVRVEANLCAETMKALGTAEQKKLMLKLVIEEKERKSAEANLKNAQD